MGRAVTLSRPMARSLSSTVMSGAASMGFISNFLSARGGDDNHVDMEFGSAEFWLYSAICTFLVIFAGLMSGLTLGLMSLDLVDLEVLKRSGTHKEQSHAAVIYPVVKKQHQLLVTLLLCNAAAMEALPLFLDKMVHPVAAVVLSVTFVLLFGEVIPQAVCTHHGLAIGASMIWLVKLLMVICYVVAYPLGKVLDWMLGHGKSALFRRAQLKALVSIHGQEAGKGGELSHDETTIISGALDLTEKTTKQAMTPIESMFSLDVNSRLDREVMNKILRKGHSRIPVYSGSPKNIIGLLLIKNLLLINVDDGVPVSALAIRRMPRVYEDVPLYDMLNEFQKGGSHMAAVVSKKPRRSIVDTNFAERMREARDGSTPKSEKSGEAFNKLLEMKRPEKKQRTWVSDSWEDNEEVVGIITLEDVIEELLQEEIVDETDEYVDVHRKIRVSMMAAIDKGSPNENGSQPMLARQESSSYSAVEAGTDTSVDGVVNGEAHSSANAAESEEEVGSHNYEGAENGYGSGRYESTVHYRDDACCKTVRYEDDVKVRSGREDRDCNGHTTRPANGHSISNVNGSSFWRRVSRESELSEPLLGGRC